MFGFLRAFLRGPLSTLRWRTRLILWGASVVAGLVVVGFAKLAENALSLMEWLSSGRLWVMFFVSPAVGMMTVWATRRFFAGAQGSGIPQVIAATRLAAKGKPIDQLVSLRIAVGKVFLGAFALIGGFSAGREGPSVQVAASIMQSVHRLLPHTRALRMQDLVLAGGVGLADSGQRQSCTGFGHFVATSRAASGYRASM